MRFDASMQFLQLLSALDIGWAATALVLGARRRFNPTAAAVLVLILGVVCVWAIWRYLDIVGFGPGGSWIVSGSDLMTYVIPYDMGAAAVAVALLVIGSGVDD